MAPETQLSVTSAPDWFGAAARDIAFLPIVMSVYAVFYAAWWPFALGWVGAALLLALLAVSTLLVIRGVLQIRHAAQFSNNPTPEIERERKLMTTLNSVTHPVWMLGAILLFVFGQGRWVLSLMVFVIGAHFLPMARILGRKIDYLLAPVTMLAAVIAGTLALNQQMSWVVVFAVAGTGGAAVTLSYAFYLAREYRRLCERAFVLFAVTGRTAS